MKTLKFTSLPCLALALGLAPALAAQDAPPNPAEVGPPAAQSASRAAEKDADEPEPMPGCPTYVATQDDQAKLGSQDQQDEAAAKLNKAAADYATFLYLNRAANPQQPNANSAEAALAMASRYYAALQQLDPAEQREQNPQYQSYNEALNRYYAVQGGAADNAKLYQEYLPALGYYQSQPANPLASPQTGNYYRELLNNQDRISPYWLGLQTANVAENVRPFLDLPEDQGVVVLTVVDDSPAKEAGVEVNDILIAVGGKPVGKISDVYDIVGETKDSQTQLTVMRRGKKLTLDITPRKRPEEDQTGAETNATLYSRYLNSYMSTRQNSAYVPYANVLPYLTTESSDAKIKELEAQIKDLTERLEKLEKQSKQ